MAAREDDAASKRKAEVEEEDSSAGQETDETAAGAGAGADVDDCSVYDDHHTIWNLNRMGRLNLMPPEWIEEKKKNRYEHVALLHKMYDDDQEEDDDGEVADEATMAEFDEICNNIFANVDLSGLNTVGGESCGVDAVGVYGGKSRTLGEDLDSAAETEPSFSVVS